MAQNYTSCVCVAFVLHVDAFERELVGLLSYYGRSGDQRKREENI